MAIATLPDDYWTNRLRRRQPGVVTRVETPQGELLASRNPNGDAVRRDGTEGSDVLTEGLRQLQGDNAPPYSSPIPVVTPDGKVSYTREPFSPLTGRTNFTPYGTVSSRPESPDEAAARMNDGKPVADGVPPVPGQYQNDSGKMVDFPVVPRGTINGQPAAEVVGQPTNVPAKPYTVADYLRETGRGQMATDLGLNRPGAEQGVPVAVTPAQATADAAAERDRRLSRAFASPDALDAQGRRQGDDPEYQAWLKTENERRASSTDEYGREKQPLGPLDNALADLRGDQATEEKTDEIAKGLNRMVDDTSRTDVPGRGGRRGSYAPNPTSSSIVSRSPAFTKERDTRVRDIASRIARGESPDSDAIVSGFQDIQNAGRYGAFVPKTPQQVAEGEALDQTREARATQKEEKGSVSKLAAALAAAGNNPLLREQAIRDNVAAMQTADGARLAAASDRVSSRVPEASTTIQHGLDLIKQGVDPDKALARGRFYTEFTKRLKDLSDVGGYDENYLQREGVIDQNGNFNAAKVGPLIEKQTAIHNRLETLQKQLTKALPGEEDGIQRQIDALQGSRFTAKPVTYGPEDVETARGRIAQLTKERDATTWGGLANAKTKSQQETINAEIAQLQDKYPELKSPTAPVAPVAVQAAPSPATAGPAHQEGDVIVQGGKKFRYTGGKYVPIP